MACSSAALPVELPMCRLGMGWPATQTRTRAASTSSRSAADSGRTEDLTASARFGCIGSIMRPFVCDRSPPEYAISRADPSSRHRAHMTLRDARGCDDGSATLLSFECRCWPTLIRRPEAPCASEKGANTKFKSIPSQPRASRTRRRQVQGASLPSTAPASSIGCVGFD